MRSKFTFACVLVIGQLHRMLLTPHVIKESYYRKDFGITVFTADCPIQVLMGRDFCSVFLSKSHPFNCGYSIETIKHRKEFWKRMANNAQSMPDTAFEDKEIMSMYVEICESEIDLLKLNKQT